MRFPDARTSTTPAPSWLSRYPGTNVELVRGGRGYAMWQAQDSTLPCSLAIGVHAQDGTMCGSVTPQPPNCFVGSLRIGRDGTVVTDEAGGGCIYSGDSPRCKTRYRWWARLLH